MKISELIKKLEVCQSTVGDLELFDEDGFAIVNARAMHPENCPPEWEMPELFVQIKSYR